MLGPYQNPSMATPPDTTRHTLSVPRVTVTILLVGGPISRSQRHVELFSAPVSTLGSTKAMKLVEEHRVVDL